MDLTQAVVLSLLQGVTEFLPISSSAHLILVPALTGWDDQGLAFDVVVHVGTLSAVIYYFRRELFGIGAAWLRALRGGELTADARLGWAVVLGTLPVALAGLWVNGALDATELRSPLIIAATTIGFGLLLWWADRAGARRRDEYAIGWRDVLMIGLAQALALIPGTSRSGVTITAGLALGMTRRAAARFSFLLSIPVIFLAGVLKTLELLTLPSAVQWHVFVVGFALSALSAYLCIHYFLQFLERLGMLPFVIYRLLLGAFLLVVFL